MFICEQNKNLLNPFVHIYIFPYFVSLTKHLSILQAICPVCRESINCDVESLWSAPPPIDVEAATDFSVTAELRELQKQMAALYLRQQQRGGIIDLEAEGVKMLVRTEDDPAAANPEVSPPGTSLNGCSNTTTVQSVTQVVSNLFSLYICTVCVLAVIVCICIGSHL